jgi:hypothetical protein
MTIDLATISFTNNADTVPSAGSDSIRNNNIVRTYAGNDIIIGTTGLMNSDSAGLLNSGTIDTGYGDDVLTGVTNSYGNTSIYWRRNGIYNGYDARIETGFGNDKIIGTSNDSGFGIENFGTIDTGSGDDSITGKSDTSTGINNKGLIDTGDGRDRIEGSIDNSRYGVIATGAGDDHY